MKCVICNQEFDTWRKIARHIKDKHNMSTKEYYDKYINSGSEHICPICGSQNNFMNMNLGYHTTCSHSCHTKLQSITTSDKAKEAANNKRRNTWSGKDMSAYKALQSDIQKERWLHISEERKVEIAIKISESWKSHTEEEIQQIKANLSTASKKRYENMSEEDKANWKNKISNTLKQMYNNMSDEERKDMITEIHRRFNSFTDEEKEVINNKRKKTLQNKTTEEWKAIKQKEINTRRKNNTLNTSKPEDRCYDLLCTKYSQVIRSYNSDKYPYFCDFYIPEETLYIECNFHWTHGAHPYTDSKEDRIILENWKNKHTKYYSIVAYVWSILDVKKFEYAKTNNLNYLAFYTEDDFKKWFYS